VVREVGVDVEVLWRLGVVVVVVVATGTTSYG
jgi:hypothetical protein